MKSQHISILPGNSDGNSAAKSPADSQGAFANYRARYQEFLNQQSQRSQRRSNGTTSLFRFAQGLFSFAIFVALFLAILTLFGFGLSRLGVIAQVSSGKSSQSGKQFAPASTDKSPAPGTAKKGSKDH
ncbi:MAG: hypothetical protein AB7P14_15485 [Blastocatellales bacterium]